MNLLPLGLLLLALWNIQIASGKGQWHRDYLSPAVTRSMKGLMAMVVLLHHLAQSVMAQNMGGGSLFLLFARMGLIPIVIFFFFSGYGLQKKYRTDPHYPDSFLRKRIPGLLLPYLLATLLYWGLYWLLGTPYPLTEVLRGFINGRPIVRFSWFLITLILFYLFFYLLMKLCRGKESAMLLGAAGYCLLFMVVCRRAGLPLFWSSSMHVLVLGMLWAVWEDRCLPSMEKHGWLAIMLAAGLFLLAYGYSQGQEIPRNELVSVTLILAAVPFMAKVRISNPVLDFLGSISYEIYILQGLFITALRSEKLYIVNPLLFCMLTIAGTIAAAWLFHKAFRPLLKQISGK